jgi:hypothetical protein
MREPLGGGDPDGPMGTLHTYSNSRWKHLEDISRNIVQLVTELRKVREPNWTGDWVNQHMYNATRYDKRNLKSRDDLTLPSFKEVNGGTPTLATATRIWCQQPTGSDQPVYTMFITDGAPTDGDFRTHLEIHQDSHPNSHVTIVLLTTQKSVVDLYEKVVDGILRTDVMQIYPNEKKEIEKKQNSALDKMRGKTFRFTETDWYLKTLLAPRFPLFDELDDKRLSSARRKLFETYGEWFDKASSSGAGSSQVIPTHAASAHASGSGKT